MEKSQKAIITMLNDDKTVPSKVKIEDIKIFNNLKKSHALQVVINRCKEMDQKLVHGRVFIDARNAIECFICQRDIKTKENLNEKGICASCQKEIDKEKSKKEAETALYKKWRQLEKDLIKLSPGYVLLSNNKIKRTVSLKDNKNFIEFSIFREATYGGSTWGSHIRKDHALRIGSTQSGIEALRLKKDFSGKNVAMSLHNKIENMVKEHENKCQLDKKQNAKKIELVRMIIKEFSGDITIKDVYVYPQGRFKPGRVSSIEKEVQFGNLQLMASRSASDSSKIKYRIKGISKPLTLKQIRGISKIAD